jgi:hypothetical protein
MDTLQPKIKTRIVIVCTLMGIVLLFECFRNFTLCFGQTGFGIVKTSESNCFNILSFRMKYFDHVLLATGKRSVSDIESIARIFSQGLFMIIVI